MNCSLVKIVILFSEDSLKDLANNLNVQFNDYTKKFQSNVANNKNLATNYLQKMIIFIMKYMIVITLILRI